jgi:hypothetical protein
LPVGSSIFEWGGGDGLAVVFISKYSPLLMAVCRRVRSTTAEAGWSARTTRKRRVSISPGRRMGQGLPFMSLAPVSIVLGMCGCNAMKDDFHLLSACSARLFLTFPYWSFLGLVLLWVRYRYPVINKSSIEEKVCFFCFKFLPSCKFNVYFFGI